MEGPPPGDVEKAMRDLQDLLETIGDPNAADLSFTSEPSSPSKLGQEGPPDSKPNRDSVQSLSTPDNKPTGDSVQSLPTPDYKPNGDCVQSLPPVKKVEGPHPAENSSPEQSAQSPTDTSGTRVIRPAENLFNNNYRLHSRDNQKDTPKVEEIPKTVKVPENNAPRVTIGRPQEHVPQKDNPRPKVEEVPKTRKVPENTDPRVTIGRPQEHVPQNDNPRHKVEEVPKTRKVPENTDRRVTIARPQEHVPEKKSVQTGSDHPDGRLNHSTGDERPNVEESVQNSPRAANALESSRAQRRTHSTEDVPNTAEGSEDGEDWDVYTDDAIRAMKDREEKLLLVEKLFPDKLPEYTAPDGGYAWVILMVSFMVQLLTTGLALSFGAFYIELLSSFEESNTKTAWIGSLSAGIGIGAGPISSILCNYLGYRLTCIAGGLISATGLMISSFAPNVYLLYVSYGVVTGMGISISYVPSVIMISFYFEKRRSFANGVACCGVAVGCLIYPVLIEYLIIQYTWRGTMIILSGILLNVCVLGALLRPTEYCRMFRRIGKPITLSVELFKDWRFVLFFLAEILWNIGSLVILTSSPDHAALRGIPEDRAVFLLSIIAIGSISGRLAMAILTNAKKCNRLLCLALATLVTVFPFAFFMLSDLYPVLAFHCLIYGLGFGFQLGLLAVVTLELFTVEKLTSAYGFVMFADGIGAFVGPVVTGALFDATNSYQVSFIFGGIVSLLAAVCFFILVFHQCYVKRKDNARSTLAGIEDHYHTDGFQ